MAKKVKDFLIENYKFTENQIEVYDLKVEVPSYFNITISTKEGEQYTKVKWDPKTWKDQTFQEFFDDFIEIITEKWQVEPQLINSGKRKTVYLIDGIDISDDLYKYFTQTWKMLPTQVTLEKKSRDRERILQDEIPNEYSRQPYEEMVARFDSFQDNSYVTRMYQTIRDAYQIEQQKLENYVVKADLKFEKSGSDKNGKNIWTTSFNILKCFSIDGIQSGRLISEGDDCIVKYKDRKRVITGRVVSIVRGKVTAIFRIGFDRVSPGCIPAPNQKEEGADDDENSDEQQQVAKMTNDEDYEQSDSEEDDDAKNSNENEENENDEYDQDDNNLDDYDYEEEEEESPDDENDTDKPYSITFRPNSTTFQRSALALMHLYDMPSCPIKNIITSDEVNRETNRSSDDCLNDASFDISDSEFLTKEDKQNINIMKYLKVDATPMQTKCVEMVLQNNISIVHGPPGCGKTSSIALMVYHLLKKSMNDKKRILLCAYSNQAVESIAKYVSPIVRALGKKMVWIPNKTMCFENKREFDYATEEQKNLSFYKILTRETAEAKKYYHLQERKWDLALRLKNFLKAKKLKKRYIGKPVEIFSAADQKKMDDIQYEVEKSLISEADVVCCTLISSAKRNLAPFRFESVFIDEASQADQMVSLIPLIHHPSKLVLLGDHKQLDSMIPFELMKEHKETMKSLYLKLLKSNVKSVMLNTQFRMHPLIANFPNYAFYHGKIKDAPGIEERTTSSLQTINTPILFVDVPKGKEKKVYGLTYKNINEGKVVERILNNIKVNRIPGNEVGVITPYHAQAEYLRSITHRLKYDGVKISSVDSFQGSERDYIILSLVRTSRDGKFGFLPDKRRINVSLTRARKGMIVVGNFSAIYDSNKNDSNPRNAFLVELCQFYKDYDAVVNERSIPRLTILVEKPKPKPKPLIIKNIFNPKPISANKKPESDTAPDDIKIDMDTNSIDIDDICNTEKNKNNNVDEIEYVSDYDDDDDSDDYFQYLAKQDSKDNQSSKSKSKH